MAGWQRNALSTITHSFFILAMVSVQWVLILIEAGNPGPALARLRTQVVGASGATR
jgi:hypothetical protein